MKRNVDLTEEKIFSNQNLDIKMFALRNLQKHPWETHYIQIHSDTEIIGGNYHALIATGNKSERREKKRYEGFVNGHICERCGNPTTNVPWRDATYTTLCSECLDVLEKRFSKQIQASWRYKKNDEIYQNDWLCLQMNLQT